MEIFEEITLSSELPSTTGLGAPAVSYVGLDLSWWKRLSSSVASSARSLCSAGACWFGGNPDGFVVSKTAGSVAFGHAAAADVREGEPVFPSRRCGSGSQRGHELSTAIAA